MNIDLSKLLYNQTDEIVIDEVIDIPKEYLTNDIKDISKYIWAKKELTLK